MSLARSPSCWRWVVCGSNFFLDFFLGGWQASVAHCFLLSISSPSSLSLFGSLFCEVHVCYPLNCPEIYQNIGLGLVIFCPRAGYQCLLHTQHTQVSLQKQAPWTKNKQQRVKDRCTDTDTDKPKRERKREMHRHRHTQTLASKHNEQETKTEPEKKERRKQPG